MMVSGSLTIPLSRAVTSSGRRPRAVKNEANMSTQFIKSARTNFGEQDSFVTEVVQGWQTPD